jgi:hypothetical protein
MLPCRPLLLAVLRGPALHFLQHFDNFETAIMPKQKTCAATGERPEINDRQYAPGIRQMLLQGIIFESPFLGTAPCGFKSAMSGR